MSTNQPTRVILTKREHFYRWKEQLLRCIPPAIWPLIDPDTLEQPTRLPPIPEGAANSTHWSRYNALYARYKEEQRLLDEARKVIRETLGTQLHGYLEGGASVRSWLTSIEQGFKPTPSEDQFRVETEYATFMDKVYTEWPTSGPAAWLLRLTEMVKELQRVNSPEERKWRYHFSIKWSKVARRTSDKAFEEHKAGDSEWTPFDATSDLQEEYERWRIVNASKPETSGRSKGTRIAAVVDFPQTVNTATFNGAPAKDTKARSPRPEPPPNAPKGPSGNRTQRGGYPTSTTKRGSSNVASRKRAGTGSQHQDIPRERPTCQACERPGHSWGECFLVTEKWTLDSVEERVRGIFETNMKNEAFRRRVEARRQHLRSLTEDPFS
ncbi:hypothetical protein JX266_013453 [Neoarthrinium moseri]|nr:hypothetical protein JX266_013453 [Neoarthrinium moseri]